MRRCQALPKPVALAALLCCALLGGMTAQAATRTVMLSGQAAPGTAPGVSFLNITGSAPLLNDNGQVVFTAVLTGSGVTGANSSGIWRDSVLVARSGNNAIGSTVQYGQLGAPVLGANGQVAYTAQLLGNVVTGTDQALFRDGVVVARAGSPAPGLPGVNFGQTFSSVALGAAGQVVFHNALAGGVTAGNDGSIWRDTTLFAREGNLALGVEPGATFGTLSNSLSGSAAGQPVYIATLAGVAAGVDRSLWRGNSLFAREGDAAPGLGAGVAFADFLSQRTNGGGQVAFVASVAGTGVTASNGTAIWRDGALVARTGSAAGGTAPGIVFQTFDSNLALDDVGRVAYRATLAGFGIDSSNTRGLWRDSTLIAREGSAVPDGSAVYVGLSLPQLSTGGPVLFSAGLGGAAVTSANNLGLFLSDGEETLQAVRKGDALAGSFVSALQIGTQAINRFGQFAFSANLVDGRSGHFVYTPELRWRRGASGSWDDSVNWTLGLAPDVVHDVAIDPTGALSVTGPAGAVRVGSLQLGGGAGIATLVLAGGSIATDAFTVHGRGVLTGSGSIQGQVANQGELRADNLVIASGVVNEGTIRGAASGGQRIDTVLINTPQGWVRVNAGERLLLNSSFSTHLNSGTVDIAGGELQFGKRLVNQDGGRILINGGRLMALDGLELQSGQLQVSFGGAEVFGAVNVRSGARIVLSGNSDSSFYDGLLVDAGGELRVSAGSTAVFFGTVQQRSGALFTGTGSKFFEGGLSVGASPGLGLDAGSVSFGAASTYLAEIGGTLAGSGFDQYRVAGHLAFGGTLQLVSWQGFEAQAGQRFDLFDWGSASGQFAHIDASGLLLAPGTQLDTSRLYLDGSVGVLAAVPEPETWALLAAGLALVAARARRRRA